MKYGSWDMECNKPIFLSFFAILLPWQPRKSKFWKKKKMKKMPRDIILHKCTKNHDHILHCAWDITHDGCNFYFSFWAIFLPFYPITARKIKIFKKWKDAWRYYLRHVFYSSWDMVFGRWMDRYTDWQKDRQTKGCEKSDIYREVDAPPDKSKCHIRKQLVVFLGHIFSQGINVDPSKTELKCPCQGQVN